MKNVQPVIIKEKKDDDKKIIDEKVKTILNKKLNH
jgi:hypothetical protein